VVASVSSASTLACDVYSLMSKEAYTLTLFCLVFKSLIKSMTFLNLGSDKLRKLKSYEKIVSSLVSDDTFFISLLSKSYLSFSSSWIHLIQPKGKVVVSLHETGPKDKKYYIMQCMTQRTREWNNGYQSCVHLRWLNLYDSLTGCNGSFNDNVYVLVERLVLIREIFIDLLCS